MQLNRSFLKLFLLFFLSIFTCTYALGAAKYYYSLSYFTGTTDTTWSSFNVPSDSKGYTINQMSVDWSNPSTPKVVVGLDNTVQYYNGTVWSQLTKSPRTNNSFASYLHQMSVDWSNPSKPRVVVGLEDGTIQYYNGTVWVQVTNKSNNGDINSSVDQMSVDWSNPSTPKIVIRVKNGRVLYYDGTYNSQWWELQNTGWGSSINQMSVDFKVSTPFPKVVVGLDNGAVLYYDGTAATKTSSGWWELQNTGWGSPVNQMSVDFSSQTSKSAATYFPKIVVGLDNVTVLYYDGTVPTKTSSGWWELPKKSNQIDLKGSVDHMSVDFSSQYSISAATYFPKIVVGLNDGPIVYFDGTFGSQWYVLPKKSNRGDISGSFDHMSVDFSSQTSKSAPTYFPKIVFGTETGAVEYFDGTFGSQWWELHKKSSSTHNPSALNQMSVDFSSQTSESASTYFPKIVLGFGSA